MDATQKRLLPQEGTDSSGGGESLPVARSSAITEDRTAGCHTYSGGGNVSPSAEHTQRPKSIALRTPTDTPISLKPTTTKHDSTTNHPTMTIDADKRTMFHAPLSDHSSSAAIPPAAAHNAWTLVESKKKKKWPKKKRLNTTRAQAPTSESGGRSEQVTVLTADVGTSTMAKDIIPGLGKAPAEANSSETSQDQLADTRNKPWTQRRPNPVARRSYWRERSSGKASGEPSDNIPTTSSQTTQKRTRLDDTISPRGEHKRRRTERQTHASGSYSRAAQSHLSVAVTLSPRTNMTLDEADNVQEQIQNYIFDDCIKPCAPGTTNYAPAFLGKAFLGEGVLKLWCQDDQALSWLQNVVPKLKSPREGTTLDLIKQQDIPVRVRSALFVPKFSEDIEKLRLVLTPQNPWYKISTWVLYAFHRIQGQTPGIFLVLGIPREQIDHILEKDRRLAYSTGSIYIRFFTKEGVSDVPPPQETTKQTHTETTETPTDDGNTVIPNDHTKTKFVQTQIPSTSTVLEDIEAVLAESPRNSQPDETKWGNLQETTDANPATPSLQELQEMLENWAPKGE